jgi:hypothetical protein
MLPAFKLYRINKHPDYEDFSKYRTHNCNPEFIKEVAFKFQLCSSYPQSYLVKLGFPQASKIIEIDEVKVHLILQYSHLNDAFGLWTFPDAPENIAWFEEIFTFLIDHSYQSINNKHNVECSQV